MLPNIARSTNAVAAYENSLTTVVDPKIFKQGGAEDNLSAPSSFIANAHNEVYAFYMGKAAFLTEI